jgi:hypothetical protein
MIQKPVTQKLRAFFIAFKIWILTSVNAGIDRLKLLSRQLPVVPSIPYLCRPKSVFADFCFLSFWILRQTQW